MRTSIPNADIFCISLSDLNTFIRGGGAGRGTKLRPGNLLSTAWTSTHVVGARKQCDYMKGIHFLYGTPGFRSPARYQHRGIHVFWVNHVLVLLCIAPRNSYPPFPLLNSLNARGGIHNECAYTFAKAQRLPIRVGTNVAVSRDRISITPTTSYKL